MSNLPKNISHAYIYALTEFHEIIYDLKDIFKLDYFCLIIFDQIIFV